LTLDAINELRALVRAEKKARPEALLMWVPLVAALKGLGGIVLAVLTLMAKSTANRQIRPGGDGSPLGGASARHVVATAPTDSSQTY
jgi:hypothetical protein